MRKSLLYMCALAVLLLAAYLVMSQMEQRALTPHEATNFVGADSGMVNRIVVTRLGEQVELNKSGDSWTVIDAGKPQRADMMVLEQIANIASNLTVGEIISSNPEKQMLFQVDTLLGKRVSFYRDTKALGELIVGKAGSDFRSTYVRKPESNDVYLAGMALTRFFDRSARGYRDKVVAPLDSAKMTMIDVKGKDFEYNLIRIDSIWTLKAGNEPAFVADHGKALQMIGMLANLRVADFVSDAERDTISFESAHDMVTVHMIDGSSVSLILRAKTAEAKDYYVKFSTLEDLFTVFEGTRNSLMKKPDDYKPGAA